MRYPHRDHTADPPRRNRHLTDLPQHRWFVDFADVGVCFVEDVDEEALEEAETATGSQAVTETGLLLARPLVLCGLVSALRWRQLHFRLQVKLF